MTDPVRLAMDHNFPEPLLQELSPWIPEVEFHWLRDIHPELPHLDDRKMIIALHQLGWVGLVTNNYKMLSIPTELAAILKTQIGFFCIEGTGDDPVRAAGALLLDLPGVLKDFRPGSGAIFHLRPRRPRPEDGWGLFKRAAERRKVEASDLYAEVQVSDVELATDVLGS